MGWETRKGRGRYYTRSRKVNGRVVREYVGTGASAALIAECDAVERAERARVRATEAATQRELADLRALTAPLEAAGEGLERAALVAAGYRRHHRGEWRKRRGGQATETPN